MAIDPFAGSEVYSADSMGAQMGIDMAQSMGMEMPLAFRMLEHLPGITQSIAFTTARGTSTMMRGGFMEGGGFISDRTSKLFAGRRSAKHRIIDPNTGTLSPKRASQFVGGRTERGRIGRALGMGPRDNMLTRRASRLMGDPQKAGFLKSAKANNFTMRPRALTRFHSLSVFGPEGYTPFGFSRLAGKSEKVAAFAKNRGIVAGEGERLLGGGLLSAVGAGSKIDKIEKRIMEKGKISRRMQTKLDRFDRNIKSLANMNNPAMLAGRTVSRGEALRYKWSGNLGTTSLKGVSIPEVQGMLSGSQFFGSAMDNTVRPIPGPVAGGGLLAGGEVGVRGNLMASSLYGGVTRYAAGYFRGAKGFGILRGAAESELEFATRGATRGLMGETLKGAEQSIKTFGVGLEKAGIKVGGKAGAEAAEIALREGVFKTIGKQGAFKALGTQAGAKVLGARALAFAIPGVNLVATAMLAYDLGAMAGEVVKSGINLAKDAQKSMKGSISKPLFGMGYKDTEAAATSRARGVMAIQNSQLNARSALGNEAAMMAAHFG